MTNYLVIRKEAPKKYVAYLQVFGDEEQFEITLYVAKSLEDAIIKAPDDILYRIELVHYLENDYGY